MEYLHTYIHTYIHTYVYTPTYTTMQAMVLSNDVSIPIGLQEGNIRFIPERYEVLEEIQKLHTG